MLARPVLTYDLKKIKENAARIRTICTSHGIEPVFITKVFCAAPEVISAVQETGYTLFGDSRLDNIIRAKKNHPGINMMLIRTPSPQEAEEVVKWADSSIQSEISTVTAISEAAVRMGTVHDIFIDIDVGDIRDGLFGSDQVKEFASALRDLPGVRPIGVLTNVGCYGSVMPDENNTRSLIQIRDDLNEACGFEIQHASFGGTVAFSMIMEGRMPEGINQFRSGEAILLGEDTTGHQLFPDLHHDAVILSVPVLENHKKSSVPQGTLGRDVFGRVGEYPDRGIRSRVIGAAGRQDVESGSLTPIDDNIMIIGCSSDHLILDVEDCVRQPAPGDLIPFRCGYMAVLTAATSEYVEKRYINP